MNIGIFCSKKSLGKLIAFDPSLSWSIPGNVTRDEHGLEHG
jgi:hypothetical protein